MYPDQLKGKRQRENTRCSLQQSGKQNCLLLRRAASKEKQDTTRDLVESDRANVQTHQKTRKAKGLPDHKQEVGKDQR